ncbi:MAG TPA: four helix bundle protein [Longimicrobiaceae bacterium]|nr:four helix bundle protein [Longimicrobiaceae bacterium]
MSQSIIRERSYAFALGLVELHRELVASREYILSRQMLRAGTSVGANVEEALAAQSRRDFVSKLSIARKEARECRYWLRLLRDSNILPGPRADPMIDEADALVRILTSIILSSTRNS